MLLLLQWLQDAPAYRDMQGGGAGLSAPACPADDSPQVVGPCNLEAPRSGLVRLAGCLYGPSGLCLEEASSDQARSGRVA